MSEYKNRCPDCGRVVSRPGWVCLCVPRPVLQLSPPDRPVPMDKDMVVLPEHYTQYSIEPVTFIMRNQLPFAEGNVIKYVARHNKKDKAQDVKKAINYALMILENTYGIRGVVTYTDAPKGGLFDKEVPTLNAHQKESK